MHIRFRLKSLIGIVTAFCLLVFIAVASWRSLVPFSKQWQINQVESILQRSAEIESVQFDGHDEGLGFYELDAVSIVLKGRPSSKIVLLNPAEELGPSLKLAQIGDLQLQVEFLSNHRYVASVPVLGDSELALDPGVDIGSLDDLIANYDKVYSYFRSWPTLPDTKRCVARSGKILNCGLK